jgi:hypothetical protein
MREGILREGSSRSGTVSLCVRYRVDTMNMDGPAVHLTLPGLASTHPVLPKTTRPHMGGLRWWFTCPLCRRRVRKLFLPPRASYFGCRFCHALSYASRNASRLDRCTERARGIRTRLGGSPYLDDPFPPKPKGMWWKTYWCLMDRYMLYDGASSRFLLERLESLRSTA